MTDNVTPIDKEIAKARMDQAARQRADRDAAARTTKAPAPRKAPAKKAPAKAKEFAPIVKENGRLDHSACGHDRDMKGRAACRAFHKATLAQG